MVSGMQVSVGRGNITRAMPSERVPSELLISPRFTVRRMGQYCATGHAMWAQEVTNKGVDIGIDV